MKLTVENIDVEHVKTYLQYAKWLKYTTLAREYGFKNERIINLAIQNNHGFGQDTEKLVRFLNEQTTYNPQKNYKYKSEEK